MSLIKSISGIRGTIGGKPGDGLSPIDIVKFTYAYCATLPSRKPQPNGGKYKIVVGKDARLSGGMVENLVVGTLMACGVDVVRIGLASTPTTELAVMFAKADGGIILSLTNVSLDEPQEVEVNIAGANAKAVSGRILTCNNIADYNDFEHPNRVQPVAFKDAKLAKNVLKVKVPARSIVVLDVK